VLRVAVDGVDGAGKTTFADELAAALRSRGVPVVRASVDGFHNPAEVRYRSGPASPEGFFRDSYDYALLKSALLDPLGADGDRRIRRAVYDVSRNEPVDDGVQQVAPGAVLVLDGIFLHRPELRGYWDLSVFLEVDFAISVARLARRDGSPADPADPANARYVDGQRIYLVECAPADAADMVVDNNDLAHPVLRRRGTTDD
jgi:uridine kinase